MEKELSEIERKMLELYKAGTTRKIKEEYEENRRVLVFGDKDYEIVSKDLNIDGDVEIIVGRVVDSGVLLHFVYLKKEEEYRCVGITFSGGHYMHLDEEIEEEIIIKKGRP